MIKYQKQLENRNDYYLPLIDLSEDGKKTCNYKLPLSFYIKYQKQLIECKNYIEVFKKIDIWNYYKKNYFIDYDNSNDILSQYEETIEEINYVTEEFNKIDFNQNDIENIYFMTKKILKILINVYPHNKKIYEESLKKYNKIYDEIKNYSTIIIDKESLKYHKIYLPDSWYILPSGNLYNTGNGHKGTSLVYDYFYTIKDAIKEGKSLQDSSKYFCNLKNKIRENGFTRGEFKNYLNISDSPIYSDKTHEFPTCHEKNTLNHIVGVIEAKEYFYGFFENLQEYTQNPDEEFNKLERLTNNEIGDIFVRCCGFYKVESTLYKTITTSDINYKETLKEYILNDWKINFISPIVIERDLKIIDELNMESPFIKKYQKDRHLIKD